MTSVLYSIQTAPICDIETMELMGYGLLDVDEDIAYFSACVEDYKD